MTLHLTKSDNVKQTMDRMITLPNHDTMQQCEASPIMTKCTNEQEKIDAWMKKKDEWAKQLISSYQENQIINEASNFIKKDFIPFRNMLVYLSDDEHWNVTASEFDFHCNQGLIGHKMLLDHTNRNIEHCTSKFHNHVQKSIRLNQEMFHCFE